MNNEKMTTKSNQRLLIKVLSRYLMDIVFICAVIFIPAGTLKFFIISH